MTSVPKWLEGKVKIRPPATETVEEIRDRIAELAARAQVGVARQETPGEYRARLRKEQPGLRGLEAVREVLAERERERNERT